MTHEVSTATIMKNLGYIPAIFLGLSPESYTILIVFMIIDTITGVARAGIIKGWKSVTSFKLTSGIISKATVVLIPLLIVWAGKGVDMDMLWFAKGTLGMLILAQFYSIIGNIYAIHIRKDIHEFDAVAWILLRVKNTIEKLLVDQNKGNNK